MKNNPKKEKKIIVCDYCSKVAKLRGTPYLADIGLAKNGMCESCWVLLDENSVGSFND